MGWQGLDFSVTASNGKDKKTVFAFEADPDDTYWAETEFTIETDRAKLTEEGYTSIEINIQRNCCDMGDIRFKLYDDFGSINTYEEGENIYDCQLSEIERLTFRIFNRSYYFPDDENSSSEAEDE